MSMYEASMNLDIENLKPLLERISVFIEAGFGAAEISQILALADSMEIDTERDCNARIQHKGRSKDMLIKIVKEDVDAINLYVFADKSFIKKVNSAMIAFCEEFGL